jgi:glycine dehydrogenase
MKGARGEDHPLTPTDRFVDRHIGPRDDEIDAMLAAVGYPTLASLVEDTIPSSIRLEGALDLGRGASEREMLQRARGIAERNESVRSYRGMGYVRCEVPPVIQRNILENPGWYTQYTPYQAEIAQGRLEALLNFQTVVADLCGLEVANASLLDEGTAAAEAMAMCYDIARGKRSTFVVADDCHPQTLEVVRTRALPLGIEVVTCAPGDFELGDDVFGVLLAYPATDGSIRDYEALCERAHEAGARVVVATDLLALTMLRAPGEFGADVAVGSAQRFGVPMGYGGPHAAFFATREAYKRRIPGRIVGVSRDAEGRQALRLALQTREQHIRRGRATSNICTSQVLLAVMASMYAVYHGPEGLRAIAGRVRRLAETFAGALREAGLEVDDAARFDTVPFVAEGSVREQLLRRADDARIELRHLDERRLSATLDEATTIDELRELVGVVTGRRVEAASLTEIAADVEVDYDAPLARRTEYLTHPIFSEHHSEHEMLRYMHRLQSRDLSLTTSMIPLGSCTMKLNATAEMLPITWSGFAEVHPFTDPDRLPGYHEMIDELSEQLAEITGLPAVTLQPNAGSQGEYTGLLLIQRFHAERGESGRDICLIPESAHGTNPASAVMAGMEVVVVDCDDNGNIDLEDLRARADEHAGRLAALMVTYPSTHGVFEEEIVEICEIIHERGGQVYMDGANMNAQVGLCRPGDFGIDVCHLNLHKTFCIPHGGGGPGVGPVAAAAHLAPFMPTHGVVPCGGEDAIGPVASAPWGSAGILPISWMYISMMGAEGLTRASQIAILNANYLARRLDEHYEVLYTGRSGNVAHEFILDLRGIHDETGVTVADIAKRLMDYGFHAPTISWPVHGTMMVEPTESESKAELDRFADALIAIREEIQAIADGELDPDDNPLKGAPHTAEAIADDDWSHGYSRRRAAFPTDEVRARKFWPSVARIDEAYGDRNLMCACPPLDTYE